MKVFLSWSGSSSRRFAKAFHDFISDVMPWVQVYISDEEIESGERWLSNISDALENSSYGVIFLTDQNKNAPWVLFEAGALSKFISDSRVVPLLCDVSDIDLTGSPLSHFQYRKLIKDDVERLLKDINNKSDISVGWERINKTFGKFWPDYEPIFSAIQSDVEGPSSKTSVKSSSESTDMEKILEALNELLNINRSSSKSLEFKVSNASRVALKGGKSSRYSSNGVLVDVDERHKIRISDDGSSFKLVDIETGAVLTEIIFASKQTISEMVRAALKFIERNGAKYDL